MPSKEEIYDIWAPASVRWSPWVKPVLFGLLSEYPAGETILPPPPAWVPPADGRTALVLNLPGAAGVFAGLAFARHGYRPIPLYNAMPAPVALAAVDVVQIGDALERLTPELARLALPDTAPPAFLLDQNRGGSGSAPPPESFDNRSVSFTTDFPSAKFLSAAGIGRVVLLQDTPHIQADLAHTLRRWQEAGLVLEFLSPLTAELPMSLSIPRPSWFGFAWQRVLIAVGLRRYLAGGFGGWVPDPQSAGG